MVDKGTKIFVLEIYREFVLGLSITSAGSREDRLKWSFRLYDTNKDGVIQVEEMVKVVASIFSVFGDCEAGNEISTEKMANDIFVKMDVDKDGNVSEEEFIKCCLKENAVFNMVTNKTFK